jgi:diguanylate cyclase (GGDEF)-like protein
LLYTNLDGFKPVNYNYGHEAGDTVLVETATRIRACIRRLDTVARIGGDEFLVVVINMTNSADAELVAKKIVASPGQPFLPGGKPRSAIGVSVGISIYPKDGQVKPNLLAQLPLRTDTISDQ